MASMTAQSADLQLGASCSPIKSTVCVVDLQIHLMFFVCSVFFSFLFFCACLFVCFCVLFCFAGWFVYFCFFGLYWFVCWLVALCISWLVSMLVCWMVICVVRILYFDAQGGISDCHSTNWLRIELTTVAYTDNGLQGGAYTARNLYLYTYTYTYTKLPSTSQVLIVNNWSRSCRIKSFSRLLSNFCPPRH